jgi:hypothetical protein
MALFDPAHHIEQHPVAFANANEVRMSGALFGGERGMHAAPHGRLPQRPQVLQHLLGFFRATGQATDTIQIAVGHFFTKLGQDQVGGVPEISRAVIHSVS